MEMLWQVTGTSDCFSLTTLSRADVDALGHCLEPTCRHCGRDWTRVWPPGFELSQSPPAPFKVRWCEHYSAP